MATINMAEFEARGEDVFTPFIGRYTIKALKYKDPRPGLGLAATTYGSDGEVGIFSVERNGDRPKYGLLTEVPRMLVRTGLDGNTVEMPGVPFQIRAAYAASRLIEKMAFDEAIRATAERAQESTT